MPQTKSLPARPSLDYLKKLSKERLRAMRKSDSSSRLADAQLAIAREFGFASWRAMRSYIEQAIDPADVAKFFKLVESGATKPALAAIKSNPSLVKSRDDGGRTPLHVAAEWNNVDLVRAMLKAGADPDAKYGDSAHTPLSWALTSMAFDAARALVRAGVKPDLFCAAGIGDLDAVRKFFDARGNLAKNASRTGSSRFDEKGKPLQCPPTNPREIISDALYIAARNGQAVVVQFLLERKPDLSFRAYLGATPLHWAYFGNSGEVIQQLLDVGADASARDPEYRCTPRAFGICVTSSWGFTHLVIDQLKRDRTLATLNEGRGTPLHEAARAGHINIVKLLLATGADPTAHDVDEKKPVDLAREAGKIDVVKLLSRAKQFKSAVAKKVQWMPLMDAAFKGNVEVVRKLLDAGANPNVVSGTQHRHRPLHRAIEFKKTTPRTVKHEQVVTLLLDRGADPKLRGTLEQLTALQLSAIGDTRFVANLRERFESLDIFHAAVSGDEQRVASLLTSNPELATSLDENGWTPLHYGAASRVDRIESLGKIAKLLIRAGADPNAPWKFQGKWPLRPLYYACGRSNNQVVARVLLEAGADACDNETIFHAADEQHDACLSVIEELVDAKKLAKECTKALAFWRKIGRKRAVKWLLAHGAKE